MDTSLVVYRPNERLMLARMVYAAETTNARRNSPVKPVLFSRLSRLAAHCPAPYERTESRRPPGHRGRRPGNQARPQAHRRADGDDQGLGFAIFYTLLGLPLARMAERMSRTRIVAVSLAIFGVMVSLCGSAQSFWRLLLFRVGVGVGDAGFGPPVASLIGDHYPRDRRASAMSIIWLGAPLGVVAGSTFAGWMAENVSWRAAFVGLGAPALLVALLALFSRYATRRAECPTRSR